jgi:hypothetical protein
MRRDDIDAGDIVEKEPPYSREAEQGLLGCLLQDNESMALVVDLVDGLSFYSVDARTVFEAVAELLKQRQPADMVTVFELMQRQGSAEECGGLRYLAELQNCVPSARNARRYAEIVADRAAERALIAGADEVARISWQQDQPLADRMEQIAGVMARVEQQRKGPGRRVPVLGLKALREASEAVRWTVKHVVPAASIGMLFGGSGTFKSFIALDLALHVVHGLPWMGRQTVKGQVLYIAAEGGAGLWGRIDAWHRARNLKWEKAPLFVVPAAIDLTVDAWRVVDAAQAIGACPAMVIVDTLSQTYSGEENSANEMAAYLREIGMRFRALWACSVLLVHHTGHAATERPRGSSAIRANIDFLLGVFRDEKEMLATLSCVKQKDGELFKDAMFALKVMQLGVDEDNDEVTSLVARHLGSEDEVQRARQAEQEAGRGGRNAMFAGLIQNGMDEKSLRRAYYELLGDMDTDSKKKAYYRARDLAIKAGLIDLATGVVIDLRGGA